MTEQTSVCSNMHFGNLRGFESSANANNSCARPSLCSKGNRRHSTVEAWVRRPFLSLDIEIEVTRATKSVARPS